MTPFSAIPPIDRVEGATLSRVQYERLADVLDALSPSEWEAGTDCPGWDVRAVASHVLGGLECVRSPKEFVRQVLAGRRLAPDLLDGLNEYQVRHYSSLPPEQLATRLRSLVPPIDCDAIEFARVVSGRGSGQDPFFEDRHAQYRLVGCTEREGSCCDRPPKNSRG